MYVKVSFQPHTQCISAENSCASLPKKQRAGLTNISHVETFFTNFKFNQENHIFKLFIQAKVQAHQLNGSI